MYVKHTQCQAHSKHLVPVTDCTAFLLLLEQATTKGWLKTAEVHYHIILQVRLSKWLLWGQNPGVSRLALLLQALGENPFLAFSSCWELPTSLGCITLVFAFIFTSPFLTLALLFMTLIRTLVVTLGPFR